MDSPDDQIDPLEDELNFAPQPINVGEDGEVILERASTSTYGGAREIDRRSLRHLWLISYSDFMTILMIFFLVMYGYAVFIKKSVPTTQRVAIKEHQMEGLIKNLKSQYGDRIQIEQKTDKVILQLSDGVLFPVAQAELDPKALKTLEEIANTLKLMDDEIVIEGHTDSVPIRSLKFKSNWELSASRAFSVVEALEGFGVKNQQLSAWGFGETRPIASNETEMGRAKNRRIEIVVLKKISSERSGYGG